MYLSGGSVFTVVAYTSPKDMGATVALILAWMLEK